MLCLRFACLVRPSFDSATDARLDTGGWLTLTRQGLSPCKIRQASLGAITLELGFRGGEPRVVVLGNLSLGKIFVEKGGKQMELPPPWRELNVFGS